MKRAAPGASKIAVTGLWERIETYLKSMPYCKNEQVLEVAELLVRLHSLAPLGINFITWLDLQIPIIPARGQVILTEACQWITEHVIKSLNHLYIRQTASGNFYLGSHTEFAGFENRITLEKITTFAQALLRAVPMHGKLRALRFLQ